MKKTLKWVGISSVGLLIAFMIFAILQPEMTPAEIAEQSANKSIEVITSTLDTAEFNQHYSNLVSLQDSLIDTAIVSNVTKILDNKDYFKKEVIDRLNEKQQAERKEVINANFNELYGNHKPLTEYVKENLNDPSSFKHVETLYWDYGDTLVLKMTYRANNMYNAKITSVIKATADPVTGQLFEILDY
jgi:NADH dehydrogenase/NADH:ubiquinone oxidoreductase subunit G